MVKFVVNFFTSTFTLLANTRKHYIIRLNFHITTKHRKWELHKSQFPATFSHFPSSFPACTFSLYFHQTKQGLNETQYLVETLNWDLR